MRPIRTYSVMGTICDRGITVCLDGLPTYHLDLDQDILILQKSARVLEKADWDTIYIAYVCILHVCAFAVWFPFSVRIKERTFGSRIKEQCQSWVVSSVSVSSGYQTSILKRTRNKGVVGVNWTHSSNSKEKPPSSTTLADGVSIASRRSICISWRLGVILWALCCWGQVAVLWVLTFLL